MAADISLAVPLPPDMTSRPKIDVAAVIAIVIVTLLVFLSFGIVADLLLVISVRAMGAPVGVIWTACGIGAAIAVCLSAWAGYDTWRRAQDAERLGT